MFEKIIALDWQDRLPLSVIEEAKIRLQEQDQFSEDEGEQLQFVVRSIEHGDTELLKLYLDKKGSRLNNDDISSVGKFLSASRNYYYTLSPFSDIFDEITRPWSGKVAVLQKEAKPFYIQHEGDNLSPLDYQKFLNSHSPGLCYLYAQIKEKGNSEHLDIISKYPLIF